MATAATMCSACSAACNSTRSFFRAASLMILAGTVAAVSVFVITVRPVAGVVCVGMIVIVRLQLVRLCLRKCEKKPFGSNWFCAASA